jgi:hypothetical protein
VGHRVPVAVADGSGVFAATVAVAAVAVAAVTVAAVAVSAVAVAANVGVPRCSHGVGVMLGTGERSASTRVARAAAGSVARRSDRTSARMAVRTGGSEKYRGSAE